MNTVFMLSTIAEAFRTLYHVKSTFYLRASRK